VPRHLFIVHREQPDLFSYLTDQFSGEPDVTVILDRRQGEAGTAACQTGQGPPPSSERRQTDRRLQAEIEGQLATLGYAFVRLG
jgi:hypothetical protein